ncbi:MAG: AAA family ATPase [Bythopirellula sp.]|nr:AAA family ATPase [Bythopirellula sp.]
MFDQADKLRQLVRETVKEHAALEPGVPLITVSGARTGVGTSTVALRLAEELAQLGKRVVLVDGNLLHPTLASMLETEVHAGITEVLSGARSAVEVLEPITSGLHLLPATHSPSALPEMNIRSLRRLVTELRTLQNYADIVVLDAGPGMSPWVERMWTAAMQILLVTTTDSAAIRDAYTAVKMAPWGDVDGKLRLIVNQCDDAAIATRVGDGFSSTCRQFLGMKLVGSAAQITNSTTPGHRQSLRLLAADVLSQTCVYSHRLSGTSAIRFATHSQAAALVARNHHEQL